MKTFHLLYNIQMTPEDVAEDEVPENWNGADQLFVVAHIGTDPVNDQYLMVALDGATQNNASSQDIMGAWAALGEMLFQHLDPSDPFREVLASASAQYHRALNRGN